MSSDRPEGPVDPGSDATDVPPRDAYGCASHWTMEIPRDQMIEWATTIHELVAAFSSPPTNPPPGSNHCFAITPAALAKINDRLIGILLDMTKLGIPMPQMPSGEVMDREPEGTGR